MVNRGGMGKHERLIILSLIIGALSGAAAVALYYAFRLVTDVLVKGLFDYTSSGRIGDPYLVPVIMGAAALLAGVIAYLFSKETEGHGADAVILSFHKRNGHIRRRVALLELVTSSLTIGSGGSAGGEGPIALMCASLGSGLSRLLSLDEDDRKIISAVAVGSGISAILKAPLGGALFGAEFLYRRDMEVRAIYPSLIASVVSFAIYGVFAGYGPLFGSITDTISFNLIPFFVAAGIASGLFARVYIKVYHSLSSWFHHLKTKEYIKPAIGALFASAIVILVPETIGEGIGWMKLMADGTVTGFVFTYGLPLALFFLILALFKIVATSFTVGSGASGGVYVPGLFIGGSFGIALGLALNMAFPGIVTMGTVGVFAIAGMVSFFGAAAKVPISLAVTGIELVGSLNPLPFIIVAVVSAYVVSSGDSIFRSQVDEKEISRLVSPEPQLSADAYGGAT